MFVGKNGMKLVGTLQSFLSFNLDMRDFSKEVGVYMERILQMHEKVVTEINCTEHREENGIIKAPFQYLPFVSKNPKRLRENNSKCSPFPSNPPCEKQIHRFFSPMLKNVQESSSPTLKAHDS
jgi:hypothetical protein